MKEEAKGEEQWKYGGKEDSGIEGRVCVCVATLNKTEELRHGWRKGDNEVKKYCNREKEDCRNGGTHTHTPSLS